MVAELRKVDTAYLPDAETLTSMVFRPQDWDAELAQSIMPPIAGAIYRGVISEFALTDLAFKSSATDAIDAYGIDLTDFPTIATELPPWLRKAMKDELEEIFSQPYWNNVNVASRNDLKQIITEGVTEGLSIREMSNLVAKRMGSAYTDTRARAVARTESSAALNAGHNISLARLAEATGQPVGKEWLSVLGNTTRETHAALDGVIRPAKGLFPLGGTQVPYPAHASLPPEERINCQCTLISAIVEGALPKEDDEDPILMPAPDPDFLEPAKPPAPPKPPPAPVPAAGAGIPDLSELTFVERLGGSTGAGKYRDADGNFYVVKTGSSPDHLLEEYISEQLYMAGGVGIPDSRLTYGKDGAPTKISKWVDGRPLSALSGAEQKAAFEAIRRDFATDALFANWDVAGLDMDNIIVDSKGKPYRIDTGGSLRYRAQGAKKGSQFTDQPLELWTLRDKKTNPNTAKVFEMNHDEMIKSANRTAKARRDIMKRLGELELENIVIDEKLREKLLARFDALEETIDTSKRLRGDKWTKGYVDRFTEEEQKMARAGLFNQFPKQLQPKPGAKGREGVYLYDENGKKWDHLRGDNSTVGHFWAYLKTQGVKPADLAEYASDQAGDSWSQHAVTLKIHMATSREVDPSEAYFWKSQEVLDALGKAGNTPQQKRKAMLQLLNERVRSGGLFTGYENSPKSYQDMMIAQHAYTYNLLKRIDMPHTDRLAGTISLGRTESASVMRRNGFDVDKNANVRRGNTKVMKRGAAESFSVKRAVTVGGHEQTYQDVPYQRVFGVYMTERTPGSGKSMFHGDSENEFVVMGEGLEVTDWGRTVSGMDLVPPEVWKKRKKKK